MRVWQLHTRYRQRGGEDTAVDNERNLLEAAGHDVRLHTEENPANVAQAAAALVVSPWNKRSADRAVADAVAFRPDVAHIHNTWFATSPAVFPALRRAGMAVVATIHNYRLSCLNAMHYREDSPCLDCLGRIPWRGVTRRCYRDSALQSSAVAATVVLHRERRTWDKDVHVVLALTRFAADILVRSGVAADRIEVKPNVVADPGPRPARPSDSDRILFAGRLAEEKGIRDLLEAWPGVTTRRFRLQVLGSGPLEGQLPSSPGVEFAGSVGSLQVAEAMKTARALVLPSRWFEGQPMVLLEAMACGLPVIVPDLGALPEIVGEAGLVFRPGDVDSLTGAIDRLGDDSLADDKGVAARREYESRYSESVGLRRLEDVYAQAVERSR